MAMYDHRYERPRILLSIYAENLDLISKTRYYEKLTVENSAGGIYYIPDPYRIPKEDWKSDICTWPRITWNDIDKYLSLAPGKNIKSKSAYEYVITGKVQKIYIYIPPERPEFCILAANVSPSLKTAEGYKAWVLCKKDGVIKTAHCTCMAGLGEACSHIAAILFSVELAVRSGNTSAVTDKKCEWNNKCAKKVNPAPLDEINLQKTKWFSDGKQPKSCEEAPKRIKLGRDDLKELRDIAPDAVFFTAVSVSSSDSSTDTASEEENCEIPLSISEIIKKHQIKNNDDLLPFFSAENIKNLEQQTTAQSGPTWEGHRQGRITSSNFGELLKNKVSPNFIQKFISPSYNLNVPAVKWGRKNESVAFEVFCNAGEQSHLNFHCRRSGVFIFKTSPFLAASPDGIVHCDCCGTGVIEIKCPYKYRNESPQLIAQKDTNFCLHTDGTLKENHNYYAQVQGQMTITDTEYCDFVIWTTKDILITRVHRDRNFWEKNYPIFESFFFKHIVPALEK